MIDRISHFRIVREVGRGGMGVVYEAHDEQLGRRVAIKTLNPQGRRIDRWALDRFKTEAKAAAQVTDPRVVQVYEAGEYETIPYIAMEFVEGVDLAELIQAAGARPGEFISLTSNVTQMVQSLLDSSSRQGVSSSVIPGSNRPSARAVASIPASDALPGTQLLQSDNIDALLATPPSGMADQAETPATGSPGPVATAEDDRFAGTQLIQDVDLDALLDSDATPPGGNPPASSSRNAPSTPRAPAPRPTSSAVHREKIAVEVAEEEQAWDELKHRSLKLGEDYIRFVVTMIRDAAQVLDIAHRMGVVHRDIKPHNIMITRDGKLKVADFGLSRIQSAVVNPKEVGAAMGTPAYMSPEQCKGEADLDGRTDVYSLGVTLYQLLTFQTPFTGKYKDMVVKILGDDPLPPRQLNRSVPDDVENIILQCLQKHPSDRYDTAGALADDLTRYLNYEPVSVTRMSMRGRFYLWVRRSPLRASLVAVILLGGLLTGWLATREKYEPFNETVAADAMQVAVPSHPFYAAAQEAQRDGEKARDEGDFATAYDRFKRAATLYQRCEAWDPEEIHEKPVLAARAQAVARQDHPLLISRGDTLRALADERRKQGAYQEAYALLDKARLIFEFDLTAYKSAEHGEKNAVEHPLLADAQAALADAREMMGKPDLTVADVAEARDLFIRAGGLFARCKPWNPAVEDEALAAQSGADPSKRDTLAQAASLITEARELRQRGAYEEAYAKLNQARDLYVGISNVYDASFETQAMAMRSRADAKSPLYQQAEVLFRAGDEAHRAGDYKAAYEQFKQAKLAYRETDPYDPSNEEQARQLEERADPTHGEYQRGKELMDLARQRKGDLDYEKAEELYDDARVAFWAARPYDPSDENEAVSARDRANPDIRQAYGDAEDAFAAGVEARDRGDYQMASRHFKEARKRFLAAVFDEATMEAARRARDRADPLHPQYDPAQAKYEEARTAMRAGDGPTAEGLFTSAATLFSLCKSTDTGAGATAQVGAPEPQELKKLARDADKARDAATELKTERDQWKSAGIVHPSSMAYYTSASESFEAGQAALTRAGQERQAARDEQDPGTAVSGYERAMKSFGEAKDALETAISAYSRVFKKGR